MFVLDTNVESEVHKVGDTMAEPHIALWPQTVLTSVCAGLTWNSGDGGPIPIDVLLEYLHPTTQFDFGILVL
jgi:hypothetical protein